MARPYIQELRELEQNPGGTGWQGRWQQLCETIWSIMATATLYELAIPPIEYQRFLALLLSEERFALARLVIVELREGRGEHHLSAQQEDLLDKTSQIRARIQVVQNMQQSDFDEDAYAQEKLIHLDAELHRARILMHRSAPYGAASEERIAEWLAQYPGTP
ncbi:uncharacterized protein RCC_02280 [Ramularia collo-cygni]|uniref:Uncharacterized protein n=1 Tax=Ramularia collo-cygni TaxID=112498 RepID=A0A2D3UW74_9PEZI|nr:uncharacterized protein RCC_02280 [Ramularia collo-cygni]CZT16437.1 uncharacterized protein RCC_02280 [Ramularia collo-cygni]